MYKTKNHSKYSLKAHIVFVVIVQIVRRLKQETTFELWKVHESYLKKHFWQERTFWSDGYFACSIGEGVSYDTIQEYIRNQG